MPGIAQEVLILASQDDVHAKAIAQVLDTDFGMTAHTWNFEQFPRSPSRLELAEESSGFYINGQEIERFRSVWWRRPKEFEVSPEIKDSATREFCLRESAAYLRGAFASCGVHLVNNPFAQGLAERKPYQLGKAQEIGLAIPPTLMTNEPEAVVAFWKRHGQSCIYKTFRPSPMRVLETRILSEEDLKDIRKVQYAPLIVQKKIEKKCDVRVNVFGDDVFAAEVHINNPIGDLDWRLDPAPLWRSHALPYQVVEKLKAFLRALRLEYGCIDMRLTPDGEYFFFEVNPAGQFLFVEIDTGQPLRRAMAALLAREGTHG